LTPAGAALVAFEVERALFRLFLGGMCAHLLANAWRCWRAGEDDPPPPLTTVPRVTVQLPVRDEFYVAERAIRAAAALDYPRDRLQIQVLDDSRDATSAIVDRVVAELLADGAPVEVRRRPTHEGGKAGNLNAGLQAATGELVAIFDADFVPPPAFLRQMVPVLMADERAGMAQGGSGFPGRDRSVLTRVQALMLDGLMRLDMSVKSRSGRPVHFNGSAGVWRRRCIDDCGGFATDAVAEDLDLSYRALLRGWRLLHRGDVVVPSDLPQSLAAFRAQQTRWIAGKTQVVRRHGRAILASPLPLGHRADMLLRCFSRVLYPFLAFLTLSAPLTTFRWVRPGVPYNVVSDALVCALVFVSVAAYYAVASRRVLESILLAPLVCALNLGLSLAGSAALVRGLAGQPRFARTPKPGEGGPTYAAERDPFCFVETAIGAVYAGLTALAAQSRLWPAVGFFTFVAASFLWVGLGSLRRV
jgi:cellulose synthase/poly-beta-1,6-N-acetylglucosamine synthase-like glycosyltransferase